MLLLALRPWTDASATEGVAAPSCHVVANDLTLPGRDKMFEHLAGQATALLADRKGREHVTVIPLEMASNLVCVW